MKKFIFLRWLFGLSLGLFLIGSSGSLTAQDVNERANFEELHGPTTTVEKAVAGGRAIGDDCTSPIVVNIPGDLPYADMGNTTCGRNNNYDNTELSGYDGGEDIIYELNVTVETTVIVAIDGNEDTWTGLGVFSSCPDVDNLIIKSTSSSDSEEITTVLSPGTYYVMVDTWPSPDCITTLDLTIEMPPPPPTQVPITVFPFMEDFEDGMFSGPEYVFPVTDVESGAFITADAAYMGTYGAMMEGGAFSDWDGGSTNTSYEQAFTDNVTHQAELMMEVIPVVDPGYLFMTFDFRQQWSYNWAYEWFRVLVDGVPIADINGDMVWNPESYSGDPWKSLTFDLTAFKDLASFDITLQNSGKYSGEDVTMIDNIEIFYSVPGLEFVTDNIDMGFRPIGAWTEPLNYDIINNPGAGDFSVTDADIDDTYTGFLSVNSPALPFTIESGTTSNDFGVKTNIAAAAADGPFSGTFAMFYGGARAVMTATYSGTAYTPLANDVVETTIPMVISASPSEPNEMLVSNREYNGQYKNYILPNDVAAGDYDFVMKYVMEIDAFYSINLTSANTNIAIYAEDFSGEAGPMATNALATHTTDINDFPMFIGTYYVVVSGTGPVLGIDGFTPMTAPAGVTYTVPPSPFDGELDIVSTDVLAWTYNDVDALEYRVVLGTTYPPADVVMPWTAIDPIGDSYVLSGLEPSLQYFWRIDVQNNVGITEGDIWGFTTTITPPSELEATVVDGGEAETTVDVSLEWVGPTNRAFIGYNVYRDGVLITPTPIATAAYLDEDLARDMSYSYTVSSVYDEGESAQTDAVSVTTLGVGTLNGNVADALPPNAVIEGASVRIIGLNGTYNLTTDDSGDYTTLAYRGAYDFSVTVDGYTPNGGSAVLGHGMTVTTDFLMSEVPYPVGSVIAYELDEDEVKISWDGSPEPFNEWFGHDDGVNVGAVGAGGNSFAAASRWTPELLADYVGNYLSRISVFISDAADDPAVADAVIEINVWTGTTPTLVYSQPVSSVTYGEWNEIILDSPVLITGDEEVWFGYTVVSVSDNTYPAGRDAGPELVDLGAKLFYGGTWYNLSDLGAFDYNWNIEGFVTNFATRSTRPLSLVENSSFNNMKSIEGTELLASEQINTSPLALFPPSVNTDTRAVASYDVWREKVYQPGTLELIGNTTQMSFVDFDWGIQDWGVYRWAVTVNYDADQVSAATYSNPLDKDMETTVSVMVTTNSTDTPGGTQVTFTNTSEPGDPGYVFSTTLDNSGMFAWTDFRKGVYDIDVMLAGYSPISETDVEIFEEAEFEWLLTEMLNKPTDLYVTPTAFATWKSGAGGGGFVPIMETFSDVEPGAGSLPEGWTVSPETTNWGVNASNNAGGASPEMRFYYSPFGTEAYYLMTPMMSTAGQTELNLSFKQMADDYGTTHVNLSLLTIADGVEYVVDEWLLDGDIVAEDLSYTLTEAHGVGADEFQVAWVMDGYTLYIDYWYIDDVMLNAARSNSNRELLSYKVFLDGVLATETTETEYQYDVTDLVEGEIYTADVLTVYTTGNSDFATYDFTYVACDSYDAPTEFTAAQVEGTLDITLNWTNADVMDDVDAIRIYRDGVIYQELDITEDVVSTYLDEDLEFGTYSYCLTYIYDSGAETCQGAVCSGDVTLDGNAMVDGMVMQAEYLGGAAIEDVMVKLTDVIDPDITFTFYTDETGAYGGDVLAGTYDYLVMAEGYVSQTIEDVVVALNATVTHDFVLMEFAYPPVNVIATELSDDAVLVTWHNPMYAPFEPMVETFDAGIPSNWTIEHNGTATDTWYMETPAGNPQTAGASLDGTNFAYVDSDEAGSGFTLDEVLYSPVVNSLNAEQLYLTFDQYYRHLTSGGYGIVEVFDGTNWIEVLNQTATVGAWDAPDQQMIDVSMYSNEMFQVRFHYFDNAGWSWYWAVDNVVITDAVTRMGVPVLAHDRSAEREMTGYEIYRTTCVTGDLQLMGMIPATDTSFTDNTWGAAEAGVYKWGVVAAYEQDNDSEIAFSNCLDKDMYTTVSVEVSTNSGDSPIDTDVMFTNTSEPDMGLVYDVTLDETGMYEWTEFRKGMYDIYVNKNGFQPVMETALIEGPSEFAWILGELLNPVGDLYVTPTAYATWREGGVIPFEPYMTNFDEGVPEGWMLDPEAMPTWFWTTDDAGSTIDGTPFMFVDSDAAGQGVLVQATLYSPIIENTEMAGELWLEFDQFYNTGWDGAAYADIEIYDGTDWVILQHQTDDVGSWTAPVHEMIDISEYANADLQVRFYYSATWDFYWAVDNFAITEGEEANVNRELQYYKVWLDGIFIVDTENTFYQYDISTLVPGQDYLAEVAAMYSNGMSAKMYYTFTYIPCDSFPGPENLTGEVIDLDDVLLTWGATAPPPPPGGGLSEDFETGALAADWSIVQTNTTASGPTPGYFTVNDYVSEDYAPFGTYHAGLWWDYGHQDEWLITSEFTCGAGDVLTFWSAVYEGSVNADHYYVKVSTDGGSTWTEEWDASTLTGNAWNYYDYSYSVDLSAYVGEDIKIAFNAVDGPTNDGIWYVWFIDNITVGSSTRSLDFPTSSLVRTSKATEDDGYEISRDGNTVSIFESHSEIANQLTEVNHNPIQYSNNREVELLWGDNWEEPQTSTSGIITTYYGGVSAGVVCADDFVIPEGEDWVISSLSARGFLSSGVPASDGFGYRIYSDASGEPGDLLFENLNAGTSDPTLVEMDLEAPVTLSSGTYWVSIFAYYETASGTTEGRWNQYTWIPTTTPGDLPVLADNADIFGLGAGWFTLPAIGVDVTALDFAVYGEIETSGGGGGGSTFDPGELMGANIFRDGELIAEMVTDTFYVDPEMEYGLYDYCVTFVYESGAESCFGSCVEVEVTEDCIAPVELTAELDMETFDAIYLNWNPSVEVEYRYDDGVATGQLGMSSGGTTNDVLGSVHRVNTELSEMSWYLTAEGGPHSSIDIWVFGLDADGIPDETNIIFNQSVSNVDATWNTYTFNEPLVIEGGFFLGVSYGGFVGLGLDDGVGAPYEFIPNTQYAVVDYTAGGWMTLESIDFPQNFTIRAAGMETSVASYDVETMSTEITSVKMKEDASRFENHRLESPVVTGSPAWNTPAVDTRAFTGYNIYRDGSLLVEGVQENTYTDTEGLEAGNVYCYEVTAVYSYCGESDPSNEDCAGYVGIPEFDGSSVALYPNPATSLVNITSSVEMTRITVINYVGQVVYQSELNDATSVKLNTGSYENGVYVIRLDSENGVVTKRVIIAQ